MRPKKKYPPKMIADCRDLYLKYNGQKHIRIEKEMRAMGWTVFRRRMLHSMIRNRIYTPGWPVQHGWIGMLPPHKRVGLPGYPGPNTTFKSWLGLTTPQWNWNWKYQLHIYKHLTRVTDGKCSRLMIFLPPRHGKSEMVTVRYAAWRLEADPGLNIIIGSYNQKLANRFSRRIRQITQARLSISKNRRAADEWETTSGGGVKAVGVGAGITGFGGKLIIIDDPVKSRAEAESKTYRENIWNWFRDDIYTRLEPNAAIVLIQTRWHDDDLAGRLLKDREGGGDAWEVICLPALAEGYFTAETPRRGDGETETCAAASPDDGDGSDESHNSALRLGVSAIQGLPDPLGRAEGEALCPERYDRRALLRIKRTIGSYSFAALYQQRPIPREGGLFKPEWFTRVVERHPDGLRWCRGYDLAVSVRTSADHTASFRCAMDKAGNLYIADGFRQRIEFPEQRRYAIERMTAERDTQHGIELALHGHAFIQDLRREVKLSGVAFRGVSVKGDKFTRALSWANLAEEGRVYLVKGPWINDFLDEVCRFTGKGDRHDDQVDAVSIAVHMLAEKDNRLHAF